MSLLNKAIKLEPKTSIREWIKPSLVMVYLLTAMLAFVTMSVSAIGWMKTPFIGAFIGNTLVLSSVHPNNSTSWHLINQVGEENYQLIALNDQPIRDIDHLYEYLQKLDFESTVTVLLGTVHGDLREETIKLTNFPRIDQITYFIIPFLIGLTYLGCGIWVFSLRGKDTVGQAFAIFSTSIAVVISGQFDAYTTNRLVYFWTIALGLAGGSLISLALRYPQDNTTVTRYPFFRWIGYLIALCSIIYTLPFIYNLDHPFTYLTGWFLELSVGGIGIILFIILTISSYRTTSFPIVKEQSRLVLLGLAISLGPIVAWFVAMGLFSQLHYSPYVLIPLILFPLIITLTISRYRLLNTNLLLSRALVYTILTIIATFAYAFLTAGLSLVLGNSLIARNAYLTGIIILVIALSLVPIRNFLQKSIDKVFLRHQTVYRTRLQTFSKELTRAIDITAIASLLRGYVLADLHPIHLHIFTHDPLTDQYEATPDPTTSDTNPTSDLRFSPASALVSTLTNQRSSIYLGETRTIPVSLKSEQARIALLASQLIVPLPGRQRLTGWLDAGPRLSGEAYNTHDVEYLETLCDQAALAIERAQVVADLERRVHEMNVLTRVSQGVNITQSFDDVLELIYAQTNQIVPTKDFRITLYDRVNDFLYPEFFLENDERLFEVEKYPIPLAHGLERVVLTERRPIVVEDYSEECRKRGSLPGATGIFAWTGIPLNTGAETIGVLSVASRDPTVIYTQEQVNMLQAIADQAAGAIVKTRLLEDSERRARHLGKLNELARNLTSTLSSEPLLEQILNSAVEILNCESGSLLLVEEGSGYLILKAAFGPESSNLTGLRTPKGSGLVGKAVDSRLPIIHNDPRRSKYWLKKPGEKTNVVLNDILVVPMQVKDKVLGVIEVINRRDSLPFNANDQELLIAFTSQAAVALENARLYTLTDQSLANRVEELSVMQRIDRELNTSLDVSRAIRITLEWALRQSRADAGLVGIVEAEKIRVMTSQGYTNELQPYPDLVIPVENTSIAVSIDTGQAQWISADSSKKGYIQGHLLTNARSQAVIPIRREEVVIGIILLESHKSEKYPAEIQGFLSRLSDHASIAISNAQLFSAVQAANLAKSDFVSFVSHELKTPMTSIKGFSDLLASGVVGPVNENQAHFLNTIRSNVDRMTTLVSDLADVSRLETGQMRLDFAPIQLSEVLNEVIRSAQKLIEEKKQTLTLDVSHDLPPMWGDKNRLIQVFTNLINNAYKYTSPGGEITIRAELSENQWNPGKAAKVIHVTVQDTGIGISPENQSRIFQKFYRAEDHKVRDIPGTGLGLNITKTLVEMQGGQIWFESSMDIGSTFHVIIPIAEEF